MDMSSGEWLSDLTNEDPATVMHHCPAMLNSLMNDYLLELDNNFQPSAMIFASKNSNLTKCNEFESAMAGKITPSIDGSWSSSGQLISFGSSNLETKSTLTIELNNGGKTRVESSSNEHVVAERRRREKMTQGFAALSALIPDLKKTDKASILAETAKYLKQLEGRAKQLEEQTTKRRVESVYLTKKIQNQPLHDDDDDDDDDVNSSSACDHYFKHTINLDGLLEIEARFSNNNVLLRIHSMRRLGLLQNILEEIRRLNLLTLNHQSVPFGRFAMDITIIAQVSDDFPMTMEGFVKRLGNALQHAITQN